MNGAMAGAGAGGKGEPGGTERTRYPTLHEVVEHEIAVAYEDGYAAGLTDGWAGGAIAGHALGFLAQDPPVQGSPAYRALERATLREALWPTADTLADAVAAHIRDVERAERRRQEHHNGDYGVPHTSQTVLGNPDGVA